MPKYKIDIWFDQKPKKLRLGSVVVEAETEEEAYKTAWHKTEHWMLGKVKEPAQIRSDQVKRDMAARAAKDGKFRLPR